MRLLVEAQEARLDARALRSRYTSLKPGIHNLQHQETIEKSHASGGGSGVTKDTVQSKPVLLSLIFTLANKTEMCSCRCRNPPLTRGVRNARQ